MIKARYKSLSGILLLGVFLQALLLASVHHHPFSDSQILCHDDSDAVICTESGLQHCYVCQFLATVQLYASEQAPAFELSFADALLAAVVRDACIRQGESRSTRAPPAVFI